MKTLEKRKEKEAMRVLSDKGVSISELTREGKFGISRTAIYRWIDRYKDELEKEGIIKTKRRGKIKSVYVINLDRLYKFFEERDIWIYPED